MPAPTSSPPVTLPSSDQKAALVGTEGTPSAANPYATKQTTDALAASLADKANIADLGSAAESDVGDFDPAGEAAAALDQAISTLVAYALRKELNLGDLPSASAARSNLGLGDAATKSVGTTAGTVAAGNDSRFTDARTPTSHATSHKHGGSDEIATATPAANAIPKAGSDGKLDSGWISSSGNAGFDLAWFGSGADGDVTITGTTVTLTRPMNYRRLTLGAGGVLDTQGYPVAVSDYLDIQNASAGAIRADANDGNAASGNVGGSAAAVFAATWLPTNVAGTAGATGTTTTASSGGQASTFAGQMGGRGGGAGTGGSSPGGSATAGGSALAMASTAVAPAALHSFDAPWLRGATALLVGGTGRGGGAGRGDGTVSGGGGGGGGCGGRMVVLHAKTIIRGPSTAAGCIRAKGGAGGAGGVASGGNCGGGGGGGGGSGGVVIVVYKTLTGSAATDAVDASGGNGGNGGNATGTGSTAGRGGEGGSGGFIALHDLTTGLPAITDTRSDTTGTTSTQTGGTGIATKATL